MKSKVFSKTEINFGEHKEGSILTTSIDYNKSKRVVDIEPKCSCTQFELTDDSLNITWKTKIRYSSRYAETYLAVFYDDDSHEDITLSAYLYERKENT